MCRSTVSRINFFFVYSCHQSFVVLSLHSEKKTKVKVGSATTSGCATPASGDESSDYYELDAEDGDMDTAEDADATDNHAPRYADLGSPVERYVYSPSLHSKAMTDRAHVIFAHQPNCRRQLKLTHTHGHTRATTTTSLYRYRNLDGSRVVAVFFYFCFCAG
jgi:hypothetical protein